MRRTLRFLLRWTVYASAMGGLVLGAAVLYFGRDLPPLEGIHEIKRRPQVVVQDSAGRLLETYGFLYSEPVPLYDLPLHVVRAVIAIEDRRFYHHHGVDPLGLARASFANLISRRIRQGGSTLTQQLAKVAFLTPERSFVRKFREAMLAVQIERHFTKDEILGFYLNRVYFGSGAYGIEAAAQRYFRRSAKSLTLYQAAMLAGLLRAPSRDNPHADPDRAALRTAVVLRAMVDRGYITERAAEEAFSAKTEIVAPSELSGRRYFTDWVVERLPNYVTLGQDDLIIRTTLDSDLADKAEKSLAEALAEHGAARGVRQGAMVVLAPDGAVRALVGGADYRASQFNRATQARRQTGSVFKLFVLLAALEKGFKPGDTILDEPLRIGTWQPRNYRDEYRGQVSIADAIAYSLNTAAVRLSESVGRARVIEMAERLGLKGPLKPEPSIALGVAEASLLEMTAAYAVLANRGRRAAPYAILEIRTRKNAILFKRRVRPPARLLSDAVLRDAHAVLSAVRARGTAQHAGLPRYAYGKTGTTQENRDAWFVGYTSTLVAGVWFGNDDREPMRDVTGGDLPARVWGNFMRAVAPPHVFRPLHAELDPTELSPAARR
jgi:penicillin-binding protein 1A